MVLLSGCVPPWSPPLQRIPASALSVTVNEQWALGGRADTDGSREVIHQDLRFSGRAAHCDHLEEFHSLY